MQSKESGDIYSTQEPHSAFHRRITFCLDIHNEAVKAMRFAPDAHKQSQVFSLTSSLTYSPSKIILCGLESIQFLFFSYPLPIQQFE
jgi:Proteasome regulatory subunit C-terminal